MKRSRKVALILLTGVGATAAVAYYQSGSGEETLVTSLDDCMQTYDEALCRAKFAEAEAVHERTAPQFPTQAACEQGYGPTNCVAAPHLSASGGSVFIPAMIGFMAGRALANPQPLYYGPPAANCSDPRTAQSCGRSGGGGGGRSVFSGHSYVGTYERGSGGATVTKAGGTAVGTHGTVSRGGFGASAHGHGGGGE